MADLGEEAFSSQMKVVATFLRLLEELMRNKQQDLRYGTKTQRRGILGRMKDFVGGMPVTIAMERKPGLRNGAPLKKESPSRINRIRQTIFSSRKIMALP